MATLATMLPTVPANVVRLMFVQTLLALHQRRCVRKWWWAFRVVWENMRGQWGRNKADINDKGKQKEAATA